MGRMERTGLTHTALLEEEHDGRTLLHAAAEAGKAEVVSGARAPS